MSNNDRFEIVEHYGVPSLHVIVDRSERYVEGFEDLGIEHAYFPLDDIQAYLRKQGFKARETIDLASAIMQRAGRAQVALAAIKTTQTEWGAILAYELQGIVNLCQAQFPQVKEEPTLTISYTVDSMAFNCIKCGSPLTLKKRSLHCLASGVVCNCGESYYTSWDGTLNRGGLT